MTPTDLICVKPVKGKGRGVFARRAIRKGTIIECVPILLVPIKDLTGGRKNETLNRYFFEWNAKNVAVCLGYGSLYNHSYRPNARYIHGRNRVTFKAVRDIRKSEEITINYNFVTTDKTPMVFKVV